MITITITITNFSRVINYNYNYFTANYNYHYKLLCQLLSNYMYCEFILRKIKVSKFFGFNLFRSGVKILPPWLNTLSIGADVAGTEKICFTRREVAKDNCLFSHVLLIIFILGCGEVLIIFIYCGSVISHCRYNYN